MSELTDDQLDGLFRKSAEEFDPPFDPAAWQDMKTRLDTHDNPAPGGTPLWKNLLRWGLPVCLLLLLTIGGLYLYRADFTHVDSAPVQTPAPSQKDAGSSSEMPITAVQERKSVVAQQGKNDSAQTTPIGLAAQSIDDKNQPAVLPGLVAENTGREARTEAAKPSAGFVNELGKKTAPNATIENKIAYRLKTDRAKANPIDATPARTATLANEGPTGAVDKQRTETGLQERFSVKKQSKTNRARGTRPFVASNDAVFTPLLFSQRSVRNASKPGKVDVPNTAEITSQPSNDEAEAAGLPDVNELAIRPARWSKSLLFKGRVVEALAAAQPDVEEQPIVPVTPTERGLSVRLAIAPDLSSVGLKNFARPGTNVGVLLEYRLASRWSVQAGIIQSTKIYRASTSDYVVPPGMWVTIPKPDIVDGRCSMLDIPINIRYDVALRARQNGLLPSRWFVSSGVTSYIMNKEDYYYTYPPHVYTGKKESSASTGGYGFSHLNMSVGYERALTKRLSWQVEPFLKMPLKGVGLYKINLLSTGAFFSIRYKL